MGATQTDQPFGDALQALKKEHKMTYRELAEETKRYDHPDAEKPGLSHSHLVILAKGANSPSMNAMRLTAAVFDLKPDYFVEYRLRKAIDGLDPNIVGFDTALANLERATR